MNKLHHHQPADTPSGCFSALLHCLLCGGTVSTRSSSSSPTPHSASISTTKFGDLLQNDDSIRNLSHQQAPQVPIVARLMGLETPVDMSWAPIKMVNVDQAFNRSRSVNSVDCLLHFDPKPNLLHRRAKTSLSFREVPVGDFLVVSLENSKSNAKSDKKRAKDPQKAKTEGRKDEGRTARAGRGASDTTKNKRQLGQIRLTTTRIQSSNLQIVTNVEQSDHERTMGTSCQRTGKENSRGTVRNARSAWQQRNDYYDKPQPVKSHLRSKALSKLKPKLPKDDVNPSTQFCLESSISSGATQSRRRKARSAEVRVSPRPQTEEKRRSRTRKIEDEGTETYGEVMMNKIKWVVKQDLEGKRWNWRNEAKFLYRDYLSLEIELCILDELLNQMVRDLAS